MFTLKQIALLTLAGTALAVPVARDGYDGPYGRWPGNFGWHKDGDSSTVSTVPSSPPPDAPSVTITPMIPSAPAPAPSASSSPSSDSGSSSGGGIDDYMSVVNAMRSAGGLPTLTQSSKLEANAQKTCDDDQGVMTHELNPGSMAQVLAPGPNNNFKNVYEGGWLCEKPNLPELQGQCGSLGQGWDHSNGETGHADILTSTSYTQIGCAWGVNLWACDLA